MTSPPTRGFRRLPFPVFDDDTTEQIQPPSGHFLARPPVTPPAASCDEPSQADWVDGARPDTSSLAAADYDVSVLTGFLPPDEPVQRLTGEWEVYEHLLESAQAEVVGRSSLGAGRMTQGWRDRVEAVSHKLRGSINKDRARADNSHLSTACTMLHFRPDELATAPTCARLALVPRALLHPLQLPIPHNCTRRDRSALGSGQRQAWRASSTQLRRHSPVELEAHRSLARPKARVSSPRSPAKPREPPS